MNCKTIIRGHSVEPLHKDQDLAETSNDLAEILSTIACTLDILA